MGHIENQQSALASTLIIAAKDSLAQLTAVLEAVQRHVHSNIYKNADIKTFIVRRQKG